MPGAQEQQLGFADLNITPRSPTERAKRTRTREERRHERLEKRQQAESDALTKEVELLQGIQAAPSHNGRPVKVLPPEIARMVMDDLQAGVSYQAVVDKYERFSKGWLHAAVKSGRLVQMCEGLLNG